MKPIRIEGIKKIAEFPKDEVVGIKKFKDKIIIATKNGVYAYPKTKGFKIK